MQILVQTQHTAAPFKLDAVLVLPLQWGNSGQNDSHEGSPDWLPQRLTTNFLEVWEQLSFHCCCKIEEIVKSLEHLPVVWMFCCSVELSDFAKGKKKGFQAWGCNKQWQRLVHWTDTEKAKPATLHNLFFPCSWKNILNLWEIAFRNY